jgi:hypothetical protein
MGNITQVHPFQKIGGTGYAHCGIVRFPLSLGWGTGVRFCASELLCYALYSVSLTYSNASLYPCFTKPYFLFWACSSPFFCW